MQRICITGPEATGKSTLARDLASFYQSAWVPEFAREYLEKLGRPYRFEDLDIIATGQLKAEKSRTNPRDSHLLCDTGPEVVWIWSLYKYGTVSPLVAAATRNSRYTHTLLLDTDLRWTPDPLRETPSLKERRELFQHYANLLQSLKRPYSIVDGIGSQRLLNACQVIASLS